MVEGGEGRLATGLMHALYCSQPVASHSLYSSHRVSHTHLDRQTDSCRVTLTWTGTALPAATIITTTTSVRKRWATFHKVVWRRAYGAVGSLLTVLSQIFHGLCQWKNS